MVEHTLLQLLQWAILPFRIHLGGSPFSWQSRAIKAKAPWLNPSDFPRERLVPLR